MKLKLKLKKFGSGFGFYIPSSVYEATQLKENDFYEIEIKENF